MKITIAITFRLHKTYFSDKFGHMKNLTHEVVSTHLQVTLDLSQLHACLGKHRFGICNGFPHSIVELDGDVPPPAWRGQSVRKMPHGPSLWSINPGLNSSFQPLLSHCLPLARSYSTYLQSPVLARPQLPSSFPGHSNGAHAPRLPCIQQS